MLTPTGVTAANYRGAILNGSAVHARLVFPVQNITLTDDDITSNGGIRLNMLMNPDTDLVMGKAVMSEVTVELINSNIFNGFDWTEEFHIDFGVDINGSTNWVTVGYFKGKKPEKTVRTQTITFIAYDRMQRFDVIADDFIDSLNSSETVSTLYTKLCTYIGISKSSTNSIANAMSASVSKSNLPKGVTCRTLLAWIAEVNCCYAKIKANGNVDLVWFTNQTAYTLTEDDYFGDSNIDEDPVSVPAYVRVASTDDNATGYIYPLNQSGEKYTILDNPIMLNMAVANRESVITTMLSRFSAVGAYIPAMISAVGCWLFETGDIITVVYDTNKTMSMPVFNRSLYYNGGCSDAYECTGNAARTEMTESVREQYKQGGKLAGKYSIVSGVDIDDDGVSISGNKYIKLLSGASIEMMTNGVFVLKSSNLDVDSVNGYLSVKKRIDGKTHYLSFGATRGSSSGSISADVNVGKNTNGYYTALSSYDDGATASGRNIYSQLFLGMGSYRDKNKNADVVKPVIRGKCASYEGSEQNVSEYGDVLFTNGYFEKSVFAEAYLSESLGSLGNIVELKTALNNLLSRNDFDHYNLAFSFINFKPTTTFGPFYADVRYYGILFEGANTSVAKVDFYDLSGRSIFGYKSNGDWVFSKYFSSLGGTLANGADLNNADEPGYYALSSNNTYANKPHTAVYGLLVRQSSLMATGRLQVAFGTQKLFIRFRTDATTWSSWVSIDNYGDGWLPSGTNIDNVSAPGSYGISSHNTYSGTLPTGVTDGVLEVIAPATGSNYLIQRITQVGFMCERYKSASSGTAWGSWYKYTGTLAQ